jgi:DNA polymerase-1
MFTSLLKDQPYIAADVETGGFNPLTDEMLAIGLCADPREVFIIPEHLVAFLGPLMADKGPKFIWHNGKFDMKFVRRDISPEARVDEDTMLLSYTLDELGGIHDLEQVGGDYIGAPDYKHMLKPYLPNRKTSYRVIPKPVLYKYLALDTSNTRQIFDPLMGQVDNDPNLHKLYSQVLLRSGHFLYKVERTGILVHRGNVKRQRARLEREIAVSLSAIQGVAKSYGHPNDVNPNSTYQLAELLFDTLKMPPEKVGSRSTRKEVLERLPKHPVIKALQEFRKASKALSTYITSLERNINIDGRVHATFLIHGTRTGRLSSRNPNMQNIPRDRRLRGMYVAAPGMVFVKVDLNQAELRSLACLSGDDFLLEIYQPGGKRSLHKETAGDFFGASWDEEQLMRAKAVNFGIVYGREAPSLAEEFQIPTEEAQRWIDIWFKRSPKAKQFIDKCRDAPLKGQTLITPFGRKKRHWLVTRENHKALQNEASNFPHQSIASEICCLGAADAADILEPYGIYPVNIVHDEVMFECPDVPEIIAWCQWVIVQCLQRVGPKWGLTAIPFKAEPSVGKRWSIYRKGKEFEYPYEPTTTTAAAARDSDNDDAGWFIPSARTLYAMASRVQDLRLLEGQQRKAASGGRSPDDNAEPIEVTYGADGAATDDDFIWAPPQPSELDDRDL